MIESKTMEEVLYDMYCILTFHEVVETYLRTGKPSDCILTMDGEFKSTDGMKYRDIHSANTAGGVFLNGLGEGTSASDMKVFYYEDLRIEIQPYSEGGWDYTCYFSDGSEWDGGIYDDEDAPLCLVLSEIMSDIDKYHARILAQARG